MKRFTRYTRITIMPATIVSVIFLQACGKNYTCTCTRNWTNPLTNVYGKDTVISTIHGSKSDASGECKARENDLDLGASSGVTCRLN